MAQISRSGDLTSGPMLQKIILFSLPLAASSILQLLFNAADVVVVGRFAGSTALAAVGSNGALINLLVNLFVGLSLGANVVAARCFGARDDQGVQNTVHTAVTLGLVSGVLLAGESFSSQDYVSATNIEEPKGSEMSARSVKKAQDWVENDRLLAGESFSNQDYVSATNIEEPKGSEMSARSGRTADRRTYNE